MSPGPGAGNNGQAGVITAGEWNDLNNWSFWLSVLQRPAWAPLPAKWQLYPTERYTLTLTTSTGQPLPGARVTLGSAGSANSGVTAAVTDRLGRAEFFPNLFQAGAVHRRVGRARRLPGPVLYAGAGAAY